MARRFESMLPWPRMKDPQSQSDEPTISNRLAAQRIILGEQNKARDRALEMHKYSISKLTDAYKSAPSPAMKRTIQGVMASYKRSLPPALHAGLDAYLQHSPVSDLELKRQEFLKYNPAPQRPQGQITFEEKEGVKTYTQQPAEAQAMAEWMFQQSDWERQYKSFLFGSEAAPQRKNLIGFGDGYAYRSEGGAITLLNRDEFSAAARAAYYGIPVHEYVANDGKVFSKERMMIGDGKTLSTVQPFYHDMEKKHGYKLVDQKKAPGTSETSWSVPGSVTTDLMDILSGKNEAWSEMYNDPDKHEQLIREFNQTHTGQVQLVIPRIKDNLGGPLLSWLFDGEYGLLPLPPEARLMGFTKNGKTDLFYVDPTRDTVYNPSGSSMNLQAFIRENGYETTTEPPPKPKPKPTKAESSQTAQTSRGSQPVRVRQEPPGNMITGPSDLERERAMRELDELAAKVGLGSKNWIELGRIAKDMGGWVWDSYIQAYNTVVGGAARTYGTSGRAEAKKDLPAYKESK